MDSSSEELQRYTGSFTMDTSATGNFHDIFTNTLPEDSPVPVDDEFQLHNIPTNSLAEFHPSVLGIDGMTPSPRILLNSSHLKNNGSESSITVSTVKFVDVSKGTGSKNPISNSRARGVLDVLLPSERVKSFKNVFDTFRRVLSYTF